MSNQQQSVVGAGPVTQQDLSDAGIPAIVVVGPSGLQIQMLPGSDEDDFAAVQSLIAEKLGEPAPPSVNMAQAKLTDAWLTVKACLDALPPAPEEGDDPYADTRLRLTSQVQIAEDAMNNSGSPS